MQLLEVFRILIAALRNKHAHSFIFAAQVGLKIKVRSGLNQQLHDVAAYFKRILILTDRRKLLVIA